ncbi:MAG TPA: adenylate/guanylate cyclase domain-containing protein [Solirubrobacterales bacterium]|nr:adenylate/guanylate cyclase domain-containing protein [Solirubrobacterales bacterium]
MSLDAPRRDPVSRRLPNWLRRLTALGSLTSDPEELRLRKAVLVLSSSLMATLAFLWVGTYAILGLWLPAAIPLAYQLATAASLYAFARTRRYRLFRTSQLLMSLLLPFALQWSLGGFENSSAVALWAFTCPVGALLFVGVRQAIPWFLAFAALVAFSGAIDPALAAGAPEIPTGVAVSFFVFNILGVCLTAYVLLQYFVRARERALAELTVERAKSERLLLNVLPASIASRLKQSDETIADGFGAATVLFADIVGFTPLAQELAPVDTVVLLDRIFAAWDELAERHGVEKIKTIGDAYMVAGGLPVPRADHAEAIAAMALEMGAEAERCAGEGAPIEVRIGIDTGPVVAGVIGRAKFSYDLWGDTVNTASRMESHGLPGEIQVSERACERLRDEFELRRRGTIEVKGKGPMTTYLLLGRRS